MAMKFDNTIATGHLLTVGGMLVVAIMGYSKLGSDVSRISTDVATARAEAQSHEARIRSLEIAQASQSSDLRAIQMGIDEIKGQLTRMIGTGR